MRDHDVVERVVLVAESRQPNPEDHVDGMPREPEEADTCQSQQLPAGGAAELAAQSFPQSPHTGLMAEIYRLRPGDPAVPARIRQLW